jgi:hypothetical protein
MIIEEMRALPLQQRLAGYLQNVANLAVLGARLRMDNPSDDNWSKEDTEAWENLCDEGDKWHYSVSTEELKLIEDACLTLSQLCRGEIPSGQIK